MHTIRLFKLTLAVLLIAAAGARADTPETPAATPRQMLEAVRERAVELVLAGSRSENPILRANAIEAMQPLPERALPLAQLGLEDENAVVRFTALVCIGKLKFPGMGEAAMRHLGDASPSVRAAAMFAAKACGQDVDISAMAMMLRSSNPGLRANVAMLLGLLGDASAAPMLENLANSPMRRVSAVRQSLTRLQIAEAMIRLGDEGALDALRAGAYSQFDEVRVLAVSAMGKLGDQRMASAFRKMLQQPPIELQLAAAEALARQGDDGGLPVMLAGTESQIVPVRAQAAFGLGLVKKPEAAQALVLLLDDEAEQVRLSAAASILQAIAAKRR